MQDVTIPVSIHSFLLCVEFSFPPWCFVILLHFSHDDDVWSSSSSSSIMSEALIDLFQPCLIVSSKVFQVVFVHLVYNSALFLASCFSPLLLHVIARRICIFLVSRQLVLLSALPKFFIPFVIKKCVPCYIEKFHLDCSQYFLTLFLKGPNFVFM